MGIFNNEIKIDSDNPFKNDLLDREKEADKLTDLFAAVDNQMVLAIDSSWGSGKTTFIKMWQAKLQGMGYSTCYFDCWTNDFVEEPFVAFIDVIREGLFDGRLNETFKKDAEDVFKLLVESAPKIVAGILKGKTGIDVADLGIADSIDELISDKFNRYEKSKNTIDKFREQLIKQADKHYKEKGKPFIIFVDEIDRCRPNFAITLLERIKHFFNIPNIIFVLGIDKAAISNSIKQVYGQGTEIQGYISRFVDLEYTLSENNIRSVVMNLCQKYRLFEVIQKRDEYALSENKPADFLDILMSCIDVLDLSVRDIEKILVKILLIMKSKQEECLYIYPFTFLICIRYIDRSLYEEVKNKTVTINGIEEKIKSTRNSSGKIRNFRIGAIIRAFLSYLLNDTDYFDSKFNLSNENISEEDKENKEFVRWIHECKEDSHLFKEKVLSMEKICSIVEMLDGIQRNSFEQKYLCNY